MAAAIGHSPHGPVQLPQPPIHPTYEADRGAWTICQVHPGDMQAAFFEIDWDQHNDLTGHWEPAGGMQWEDKVDQSVTIDYAAVELQGPDPARLAELWGKVVGLPVTLVAV